MTNTSLLSRALSDVEIYYFLVDNTSSYWIWIITNSGLHSRILSQQHISYLNGEANFGDHLYSLKQLLLSKLGQNKTINRSINISSQNKTISVTDRTMLSGNEIDCIVLWNNKILRIVPPLLNQSAGWWRVWISYFLMSSSSWYCAQPPSTLLTPPTLLCHNKYIQFSGRRNTENFSCVSSFNFDLQTRFYFIWEI